MQSIETKEQFKIYLDQINKEINNFYNDLFISIVRDNQSLTKDQIRTYLDQFKREIDGIQKEFDPIIRKGIYDVDLLFKLLNAIAESSLVQGDMVAVLEKLKEKVLELQNSKLFMTGLDVADILATPNITIKCHKRDNYDLVMTIGRDTTLPPNWQQEIRAGEFYFDQTNLPSYLRSPEILDVLAKKCVIRSTETANGWDLKPEFQKERSVAPDSDPFMHPDLRIKLTDPLVNAIYKSLTEKDLGHKYALIGPVGHETEAQRIENFIISGRADRIVGEGPTGPGPEHTVSLILRENKSCVKTARIMRQSFPKNGKSKRVSKYDRWVRVVVD